MDYIERTQLSNYAIHFIRIRNLGIPNYMLVCLLNNKYKL